MAESLGKLVVVASIYRKAGQRSTDRFVKKFYGQETTSHGGRYRYHRKGLLDDIPHVKLGRGVLIIKPEDLEKVAGFLEDWKATYSVRDIILSPNDKEHLQQKPQTK
jgi:hypothetical protein